MKNHGNIVYDRVKRTSISMPYVFTYKGDLDSVRHMRCNRHQIDNKRKNEKKMPFWWYGYVIRLLIRTRIAHSPVL